MHFINICQELSMVIVTVLFTPFFINHRYLSKATLQAHMVHKRNIGKHRSFFKETDWVKYLTEFYLVAL